MDSLDYRQLGYIALLTVLLTSGFWTFIFSTLKFCICFYLRFLIVHVVLLLVRPEFRKYFVGMEAKAKEVLAVLKNSNLSLDAKVNQILGLKSDIKQKNVPSAATDALFECLRLAIASPHYQLLAAGFSMLGHLIKRLFVQNEHHVVAAKARELYSTLVERMGDHKERFRAHAAQAFTDLWPADGPEVEHQVLQVALTGKNPRAKESCLVWLVDMAHQRDMLFRQYVPNVIACLEEADAHVRETAKATVIALFKNAPSHAQLDLKRQLAPVRKTIANAILSGIGLEEDLSVTRPPSRGEALRRPPSRGEALRRPPSRGEALRRPPSRGDALHQRPATVEPQRPPSRGDALHQRSATVEPQRPPSRGDALHQRPAAAESQQHPSSRGDVLHQRPTSVETQRPPSRGDALYQRSATVETQRPPSRGDALHQRPAASESQQHASSRGDVLHQRPLMVETQRPPSRGVALSQPTDSALYVPEEQTVELYEKDTPAIVRPTPVRPNNNTSGHETAPRAAASAERLSVPPPPRYPLKASEMVEPRDLFSAREFEEIYTGMLDCFQGKEEENNWTHREKSVKMLRRITHGNAPHDFPEAFMQGIKILLDGISKVALSLRTSMTTNGLLLIRDLACVCQSQLDPVIDIILQVCLKVCVNQKRIAADRGDITVTTLLENLTCNTRLLSHITTAALGNSPQLRGYSAGWITVILEHQSRHKTTPEGAKSIAEVIKVNLSYASAEVRQNYRATFWAFYHAWQTRASKLLNDLDPKVRALVEKDPHNPAKDPFVTTATPSKAGPTRPTLKGKGTKTSLAAAKRRPPLPKAEQTALPDATSINHHEQPISKPTATAPQNTSSLTSAPMRPGVAKPRPPPLDLARPATATGFRQMVAESPIQSTPTRIPAPSPSKKSNKDPTWNCGQTCQP
ncbi:clasp N terminal-domain-containing protein [Aspergillus karnatakaensis]|uniref:uncharacterized protein n=1 Tax=Aspergillus karnatakaensis TaxID=1810916 RepID=UPI003CCE1E2F